MAAEPRGDDPGGLIAADVFRSPAGAADGAFVRPDDAWLPSLVGLGVRAIRYRRLFYPAGFDRCPVHLNPWPWRMRLLTISGSLRTASSNTALLEAVARLAPPGVEIVSYLGLGELPHFNPDLEAAGPPPSVLALRAEVGAADGVLFSSPEYAHGIAGSFKNGLDWLVGSLEFPGKPVAILNAAPRASHADAQMREILRTMSARLIEPAMLTLPIQGSRLDAAGIAARPDLAEPIRAMLRSFVEAIREAQSAVA